MGAASPPMSLASAAGRGRFRSRPGEWEPRRPLGHVLTGPRRVSSGSAALVGSDAAPHSPHDAQPHVLLSVALARHPPIGTGPRSPGGAASNCPGRPVSSASRRRVPRVTSVTTRRHPHARHSPCPPLVPLVTMRTGDGCTKGWRRRREHEPATSEHCAPGGCDPRCRRCAADPGRLDRPGGQRTPRLGTSGGTGASAISSADGCAGCHRAHTGQGSSLLSPATTSTCASPATAPRPRARRPTSSTGSLRTAPTGSWAAALQTPEWTAPGPQRPPRRRRRGRSRPGTSTTAEQGPSGAPDPSAAPATPARQGSS